MAMTHPDYVETDHFEAADSALLGALALGIIISNAGPGGDDDGKWSIGMMDDLEMARRIILTAARSSLGALRQENWQAHALLGVYGPQAKARAEAEAFADARAYASDAKDDEYVDIPVCHKTAPGEVDA